MNHPALVLRCASAPTAVDASARSQSAVWTTPSAEQLNAIYPEVESLYFDLHRTPELAMHEQQTAGKLAERVKSLGHEVTGSVGRTGSVVVLRNGLAPKPSCAQTRTPFLSKRRPTCPSPVTSW
jgi:hypothetical protein